MRSEFFNALISIIFAFFKIKGLGHYRNRQNAELFRNLRNYRRRSGASTTAHACGYKHHVRTT